MRSLFCQFLMVLMLTPALACGEFMCEPQAEKMAGDMPCHEMADAMADIDAMPQAPMLFKDCSGVDLWQAQTGDHLKASDRYLEKGTYFDVAAALPSSFVLGSAGRVRGPPMDTQARPSYPSLYLTTQRLRL